MPPADPVSIDIAYRAALRSTVPEGSLAYGFKERPINLPKIKIVSNVPEEKLFSVNPRVIEFKKPKFYDEGEIDDDDEFDDDNNDSCECVNRRKFDKTCPMGYTYGEIGYKHAKGKDPKFIDVPISTTPRPNCHQMDPNSFGAVVPLDEFEDYNCECEYCCPPGYERETLT